MQLLHDPVRVSSVLDEPNLVSCAGLAPVLALVERSGLAGLVADAVTLSGPGGVNAVVKVPALVAGMVAGADSIDDMDVLCHGGMSRVFTGVRASSTLGTFLWSFTFGYVRPARQGGDRVPGRPGREYAGAAGCGHRDLRRYRRHGQGDLRVCETGRGLRVFGVKGLNALIITASTPLTAPMITTARLRKGSTNSARGAARLLAGALATTKSLGADPHEGHAGDHPRGLRVLQPQGHRRRPPPRGEVQRDREDDGEAVSWSRAAPHGTGEGPCPAWGTFLARESAWTDAPAGTRARPAPTERAVG
jgi:hypothetical protein